MRSAHLNQLTGTLKFGRVSKRSTPMEAGRNHLWLCVSASLCHVLVKYRTNRKFAYHPTCSDFDLSLFSGFPPTFVRRTTNVVRPQESRGAIRPVWACYHISVEFSTSSMHS